MSRSDRVPEQRAPGGRIARGLAAAALLAPAAACYSLHPLSSTPDAGTEVVATLNDRGRATLTDSLGQNADQVTGRVVERSDSTFTLALSRVRYFGGSDVAWTGERVRFSVNAVRMLQRRQLDTPRTALVAGSATAGLVVFILTRTINGRGGPGVDPGSGGPGQGS